MVDNHLSLRDMYWRNLTGCVSQPLTSRCSRGPFRHLSRAPFHSRAQVLVLEHPHFQIGPFGIACLRLVPDAVGFHVGFDFGPEFNVYPIIILVESEYLLEFSPDIFGDDGDDPFRLFLVKCGALVPREVV